MRASQVKTAFILGILFFAAFWPLTANAQAIKVSVADIYANPHQYEGRMVQVEGKVIFLKCKVCTKGNYTTLELDDNSGKFLTVFSYGHFPIKRGDLVRVTGIYKTVIYVPPHYTFYNEIDATSGSIEKLR